MQTALAKRPYLWPYLSPEEVETVDQQLVTRALAARKNLFKRQAIVNSLNPATSPKLYAQAEQQLRDAREAWSVALAAVNRANKTTSDAYLKAIGCDGITREEG